MEKVLFIGGRRGLGAAVLQAWSARFPEHHLALSSRRPLLENKWKTLVCDLSRSEDLLGLTRFIQEWQPRRVFVFPGGGPYGPFAQKKWKDHLWALQVSLLGPAEILHACLQVPAVQQVVLVGSSIAESQPDPNAASYCAAKHGLLGLISTLNREQPLKDVRLYSPGYMATDMLPPPSRDAKKVADPAPVAAHFVQWVLDKEASWHGFNPPD